jgi:membrane protein YdbS with pleckstrin-like domain
MRSIEPEPKKTMNKLKSFLSFLSIISTALCIIIGIDFLLINYLAWWLAVPGVVAVTSLISYFTIQLIDYMK